jgi:hypothetical protein
MAFAVTQIVAPAGMFTPVRQPQKLKVVAAATDARKVCFGNAKALSSKMARSIRRQIDTRCRAAVRIL